MSLTGIIVEKPIVNSQEEYVETLNGENHWTRSSLYSGYTKKEDYNTLCGVYQPHRALGVCYYEHNYGAALSLFSLSF